jgi:hypothetical protein
MKAEGKRKLKGKKDIVIKRSKKSIINLCLVVTYIQNQNSGNKPTEQ